jgi:hypothetical protein
MSTAGRHSFAVEDTDVQNVTAAIMQFLTQEIFSKEFYCPIDAGALNFLSSVERSMRSLPRG